jgi:hypothetical protein
VPYQVRRKDETTITQKEKDERRRRRRRGDRSEKCIRLLSLTHFSSLF